MDNTRVKKKKVTDAWVGGAPQMITYLAKVEKQYLNGSTLFIQLCTNSL